MTEKKTDVARYDRQIRLWGEEGQSELEHARICLINATATGTETLKNLVLPGVGFFTIVDGKKVSEADLGNNFFVVASRIGESRAQVACELLQELNFSDNPNIFAPKGNFLEKDPVVVIETDIQYFKQFSHIIVTDLAEEPLLKLGKFAYANDIPVIIARSNGFIGYLRIVVPEHTIVQSKGDNPPDDLRIADPWPELSEYASQFNVSELEGGAHSHVPYVIILFYYISEWKKTHDGKLPQSYAEKNEFKKILQNSQKTPDEENFPEAFRAAHKAFAPYELSSDLKKILSDSKCNVDSNTTNFWLLASALKQFFENEGNNKYLPLPGSIPDMTATTEGYLALQKIYQAKALKDLNDFKNHLKANLKKAGKPENHIHDDQIKLFCKNARFLRLIRTSSLEEELNPKTSKNSLLENHLSDPESNMNWYVVLQASNKFQNKHKRVPGDVDGNIENDHKELKSFVESFLKERNLTSTTQDKFIEEIVRYGGAELHTIASFMGGVTSQEIIKLITHQYTPLSSTFIFNGCNSSSSKEDF